MEILVIVGYIVIGAIELLFWSERPWKKVLTYLFFLGAAATLSVLITVVHDLQAPQPTQFLGNLLKKLWPGGEF